MTAELSIHRPPAFEAFVRTLEPRTRIRSCTACYLDLGNFPVSVGTRGWLIHFLSDQQWVNHWLLYVDHDGTEAVVSTFPPYGFELDADEPEYAADFDPRLPHVFERGASESVVCADSFGEFLYRFWIENEIWYALAGPAPQDLTREQRRYAEHYVTDDERQSHHPS